MSGFLSKIRAWWGKDSDERAKEAAAGSQADRDAAAKDYESFKDDQSIGGSYVGGAGLGADFERDSEPPRSS
jgi:hypothetical protein